MSGSCTVTPGYLLADGETLTEAKLRQMAAPTVKVAPGSISDAEMNLPTVQAALGTNTRPNLLTNGNFVESRWSVASTSAAAGADTFNAEGWLVRPVGGTVTYGVSTTIPTNKLSLNSVEITGASGVTTCILAQNIERALSATLAKKLTFSAWIYNNTGASYTPQVVVSTCNSPNSWGALTVQNTSNLVPCANSAWTRVTLVIDCTTLTNIANGMRVALQFPTNSLNATGKKWNVAQAKLEVGEAATDLAPDVQWPQQQSVTGTSRGLVIQNNATTPASQVDVTVDELVLKDARGFAVVLQGFSRTADLTASGVDGRDTGSRTSSTWYYVWVISNGYDHRTLFSTSATAPTLPAGYQYRARVGAVYNGSGNSLVASYQTGDRVFLPNLLVFNNKQVGSDSVYESLSLAAFVPPIAKVVYGNAGSSSSSVDTYFHMAADVSGMGACFVGGKIGGSIFEGYYGSAPIRVVMTTPQTVYWTALSICRSRLEISGYEI